MGAQVGVSLTGGGARGAYQAGVLKGLAEILKEPSEDVPVFNSFSGVSAGAINVVFMASRLSGFSDAADNLCKLWGQLKPEMIYKTDVVSMGKIGMGWLRDVTSGSLFKKKVASELLDSSPLGVLLEKNIDLSGLRKNIENRKVVGVACTAFDYTQRKSISFVEANESIEGWDRQKRGARLVKLEHQHVLASCAIPIIFSPVKVGKDFYGDGSLRNTAPISPILHLGANKVVFIGVRYENHFNSTRKNFGKPSVAEIFGTILNGLFFDTTDVDVERLESYNKIVGQCNEVVMKRPLRKVSYVYFKPTVDLGILAEELAAQRLPGIIDYLLKGLGGQAESSELASYLLFDSVYTSKLIEIGYEDAYKKKDQVLKMAESNV